MLIVNIVSLINSKNLSNKAVINPKNVENPNALSVEKFLVVKKETK